VEAVSDEQSQYLSPEAAERQFLSAVTVPLREGDHKARWEAAATAAEHESDDLARLLNSVSAENGSNTPDFILADYLRDCLAAFDRAVRARDAWYGINPEPGS
jgi:hypothetical protein